MRDGGDEPRDLDGICPLSVSPFGCYLGLFSCRQGHVKELAEGGHGNTLSDRTNHDIAHHVGLSGWKGPCVVGNITASRRNIDLSDERGKARLTSVSNERLGTPWAA
jgi:hypothetical protein